MRTQKGMVEQCKDPAQQQEIGGRVQTRQEIASRGNKIHEWRESGDQTKRERDRVKRPLSCLV